MRVMLLIPKYKSELIEGATFIYPPLTEHIVASELGCDTVVWDENQYGYVTNDALNNVDCIAFSSSCGLHRRDKYLYRLIDLKRRKEGLKFILGGSNQLTDPLNHNGFEQVFVGGVNEKTVLNSGINGYSDTFETYKFPVIYSAYGCGYDCSYCLSSELGGWKPRPVERIRDDLCAINYSNMDYFEFLDTDFFYYRHYTYEVMNLLDSKTSWGARISKPCLSKSVGVNFILSLLILAMNKNLVTLGIEACSFDFTVLKYLNRAYVIDFSKLLLKSISNCLGKSIKIYCTLLYGLPYQTYDSHMGDIEFIEECGFKTITSPLRVFPGTKLFEIWDNNPNRLNYTLDDLDQVLESNWMNAVEIERCDIIRKQINASTYSEVWN